MEKNKYDFTKFVKEQEKETGILVFGKKELKIQENAYTFMKLQSIFKEHKNNDAKLAEKILKTTLTKEDYDFVIKLNMDLHAKELMISTIVGHIFDIDAEKFVKEMDKELDKVKVGNKIKK